VISCNSPWVSAPWRQYGDKSRSLELCLQMEAAMPTAKLNKRTIDALKPPGEKQIVLWDSEIRGFGVRVLPSGLKTFIVQYRNAEGIKRRVNLGRFGVITVEQ